MDVPIELIMESEIAMRFADTTCLEYEQLRDAIRTSNWMRPILTRKRADGKYEILDGLHRYCIAKDLEWPTVPVEIFEGIGDDEAMIVGIKANAVSVHPKPAEYAAAIRRLAARHPEWTVGYLAGVLCKPTGWVKDQLKLLKLIEVIQRDVDSGRINLQSAFILSCCPKSWQTQFREDAAMLTTSELRAKVMPLLRAYHQRLASGKIDPEPPVFQPVASVRPIRVLKAALDKPSIADTIVLDPQCVTKADAFRLGVAWALRLDPESVQHQRLVAGRKQQQIEEADARRRKARSKRAGDMPTFPFSSSIIQ